MSLRVRGYDGVRMMCACVAAYIPRNPAAPAYAIGGTHTHTPAQTGGTHTPAQPGGASICHRRHTHTPAQTGGTHTPRATRRRQHMPSANMGAG